MATKPEPKDMDENPFTFTPGDDCDDLPDPPFIFNPSEEINEAERRSWQIESEFYEKMIDELLDED
jgi:hypothetical protein